MKRLFLLLFPVVLLVTAFRAPVTHIVKGKVTDEAGNPLAGVAVQVKRTAKITSTQGDGSYRIVTEKKEDVLVFSYIGYATKEIQVNGKATIDVVLEVAPTELGEVIVTGYGAQKRKDLTGAVASVPRTSGGYDLSYGFSGAERQSVGSALQGKVPGVVGAPGINQYKFEEFSGFNTEDYDGITENRFLAATDNPLSTFSIDVDAASYSNVRRFLDQGQLPPAGAIRIEEMINYFHYEYPQPQKDQPFSINTEIAVAPWNKDHQLVLIGLQGKKIPVETLPASNLVFLVDVSGSMNMPNKLPLVKASLKLLVNQLREQDRVAIVVYAGAAGLVLPPANGMEKTKIKDAIDNLDAGGSTAGGAGIRLAYKTAREHLIKNGNNRVILCTDGDFNVGESSDDAMERLIEEERKSGVFLTVLGYGMGNYKDNKMQKLADKGNGNHAYIDGLSEARKVLVNEFGGTLFTIAKDVKLQVEFNPAKVQGYRLIGYENRMLAREDFNDDKKDAGELGSGHTVTALYEIIPVGVKDSFLAKVDDLKYRSHKTKNNGGASGSDEILTVKFRYKAPDGDVSRLIEHPVADRPIAVAQTSDNFRFAAAVAGFGMLLRNSAFKGAASYETVLQMATGARGRDEEGYRSEFIRMVQNAQLLSPAGKDVGKR